jgi:hypothetical protein
LAGDGKPVHAIASSLKDLMVKGKLNDKSLDAAGRPRAHAGSMAPLVFSITPDNPLTEHILKDEEVFAANPAAGEPSPHVPKPQVGSGYARNE